MFKSKLLGILLLILLIGCSNQGKSPEKIVNDRTKVSFINTALIETIDFDDDVYLITDWKIIHDKLFITNINEPSLKVFDMTGKLLKNNNTKGKGPGELNNPTSIMNDINNSEIIVNDAPEFKHFDYNGDFLRNEVIQGDNIPFFRSFYADYFLQFGVNIDRKKIDFLFNISLIYPDTTFCIEEFSTTAGNIADLAQPRNFTSNNNFIYVANERSDIYQIKKFDNKGNKKLIIDRKYKKMKKNETEIAEIEKMWEKDNGKVINHEYYPALTLLYTDKKDNLWVKTYNQNAEVEYDLFDTNGRLVYKWKPSENHFAIRLYKNRLFEIVNVDEEFQLKIYEVIY